MKERCDNRMQGYAWDEGRGITPVTWPGYLENLQFHFGSTSPGSSIHYVRYRPQSNRKKAESLVTCTQYPGDKEGD